jgi:hypothetical protein
MSIRSFVFTAAVCVAASLVSSTAAAQAPDSARRGGLHPRVAVGVDGMLYDDTQRIPSLYALAGLEWVHPRAPFSARFDLSYFRRDIERERPDCANLCVYSSRFAVVGLSADGRYTFRSRAAIRPYVASGFGLYRTASVGTNNLVCSQFGCEVSPTQRTTLRSTDLGLGLHAGFGFAFPIRRSELTLEFLLRQQSAGYQQRPTMPVTLGIRF